MQLKLQSDMRRYGRLAGPVLIMAALFWVFRGPLVQIAKLALGGAALAFLAAPLAGLMERRAGRAAAAMLALATLVGLVVALIWLLLPSIIRQTAQLAQTLPDAVARLSAWLSSLSGWVEAHLPGIRLPEPGLEGLTPALPGLATGTLALAGSAGETLSSLSLAFVLAYFFLCDRDRMLLRLELLVPLRHRQLAVRMGNAVLRELRLYLRGQLLIALAVGAAAAAGLMLIRVRSALVLGGMVGLLNMVPYFGPFIGGIPAILLALGDGWQKAAMALAVLALVQQLDSALISPRIMGSLSGLSPAAVLVAIFAGAKLFGIVGMLLALPLFMSIRTVFRVFVQTRENI